MLYVVNSDKAPLSALFDKLHDTLSTFFGGDTLKERPVSQESC